jgi:hypothetical protein
MLVRFAIDPDALRAEFDDSIIAHRRLVRLWQQAGILVHRGSRFSDSELGEAVESLPQALRKLWKEAVTTCRTSPGDLHPDVRVLKRPEDFACFTGRVRVACLERSRARQLGVGAEGVVGPPDVAIELCRLDTVDQSPAFQHALEVMSADIPGGQPTDQVWAERFAGLLAGTTRTIVLIDRYALQDYSCKGFRYLMEKVAANSTPLKVVVFCSSFDASAEQTQRKASALVRDAAGTGLRELWLQVASSGRFGRVAHYRTLRFDDLACDLNTGIEVLAPRRVRRSCPFHVQPVTPLQRREESELLTISQSIRVR